MAATPVEPVEPIPTTTACTIQQLAQLARSDDTLGMRPVPSGEREAMAQRIQQRLSSPAHPQADCLLFWKLPGELRNVSFTMVLTTPLRLPDPDTSTAGQCHAHRTVETSPVGFERILRVSRRMYQECWHLTSVCLEPNYFLMSSTTSPIVYEELDAHPCMPSISRTSSGLSFGDGPSRDRRISQSNLSDATRSTSREYPLPPVEDICLPQSPPPSQPMYPPPPGADPLQFRPSTLPLPRRLAFTMRHVDSWQWIENQPLCIAGKHTYVMGRVIPPYVDVVLVRLKTVPQRSQHSTAIAKLMCRCWFFKRPDGVSLFPDSTLRDLIIQEWDGTSYFEGNQWVHDETLPGHLGHHVVTVAFRTEEAIFACGGNVAATARKLAEKNHHHVASRLVNHPVPPKILMLDHFISADEMEEKQEDDELVSVGWSPVSVAEAAAELGPDFLDVYEMRRNWRDSRVEGGVLWG